MRRYVGVGLDGLRRGGKDHCHRGAGHAGAAEELGRCRVRAVVDHGCDANPRRSARHQRVRWTRVRASTGPRLSTATVGARAPVRENGYAMDESDSARFAVTTRRWAVLMWTLSVATAVPTVVLLAVGPDVTLPSERFRGLQASHFPAGAGVRFGGSADCKPRPREPYRRGVLRRRARDCAAASQLAVRRRRTAPPRPPSRRARDVTTFNSVFSEANAGLLGIPLLLFSTGRLPSRRWWPALASLVAGMLLVVVAGALRPGPYDQPFASVSNPLSIGGPRVMFRSTPPTSQGGCSCSQESRPAPCGSSSVGAERTSPNVASSSSCSPWARSPRPRRRR